MAGEAGTDGAEIHLRGKTCVDAYEQDRVVAEPDLADPVTRRWFAFSRPALQAGVRAVFGFPLRVGRCASGRSTSTGSGPAS
jgi:hypothetical protein